MYVVKNFRTVQSTSVNKYGTLLQTLAILNKKRNFFKRLQKSNY